MMILTAVNIKIAIKIINYKSHCSRWSVRPSKCARAWLDESEIPVGRSGQPRGGPQQRNGSLAAAWHCHGGMDKGILLGYYSVC
jgi:hypothetical protein